jgi:hypothetical protein
VFAARWSWIVPLVCAAVVFVGVLVTTPPGFRALSDALFGSPRGISADAAAYALGAAGSLALITLVASAVILGAVDLARRRGLSSRNRSRHD